MKFAASFVLLAVMSVSTAALAAQVDFSKRYTRKEINDLVIGKPQEAVIKILGKPMSVRSAGKMDRWEYRTPKVYDPMTDLDFRWFWVDFWQGHCDSVSAF